MFLGLRESKRVGVGYAAVVNKTLNARWQGPTYVRILAT